MNPMTNVKNIQKLNERMLDMGVEDDTSWHKQYKNSAYVFIGGLPYDLTEGDILCVFSQYGEIVNLNLVRDKATGKQKGFCFLCYEDQRSTILAVDNFNGIKLGGRTIRVDHCENYRKPKGNEKDEDGNRKDILEEGCAPRVPSPTPSEDELEPLEPVKKKKKLKKHKEKKLKSKKKEYSSSSESEDGQRHQRQKRKSNKIKSYPEQDSSREKRDLRFQERSHFKDTSKDRDERTMNIREWDYGKRIKQDRHVDIKEKRKEHSYNEDRSLNHRDRKNNQQGKDRREKLSDRRDHLDYESHTRHRSRDYSYSERKR